MDRIAVIGAGAWGTALEKCSPTRALPGPAMGTPRSPGGGDQRRGPREHAVPARRLASRDADAHCASLEEALRDAELVVLVVLSHALPRTPWRRLLPHLAPGAVLVTATKGIENDTLMLMGEVIADVLGPGTDQRFTVLSGPSFAREVAAQVPTNIVVASSNAALAVEVQRVFATDWLRVYSE